MKIERIIIFTNFYKKYKSKIHTLKRYSHRIRIGQPISIWELTNIGNKYYWVYNRNLYARDTRYLNADKIRNIIGMSDIPILYKKMKLDNLIQPMHNLKLDFQERDLQGS